MLDPAIKIFLEESKKVWLDKKITPNTTDKEKIGFEEQATKKFNFDTWIDTMLEVAQKFYITHPAKFVHSGAKTNPVIANFDFCADGFLKSGNCTSEIDFSNYPNIGDSTQLYKFLKLQLSDAKSIADHLSDDTSYISTQLNTQHNKYKYIREILYPKNRGGKNQVTSTLLKQVYFPVTEHKYHLLSILTPSSIMFNLKERINTMRFSDEAKDVREAKKSNKYHEKDYSEIYGLSVIGYGGTKSQNISVLNSQNGGKSYLLSSMPPELTPQKIRPPKTNFFTNSLWFKNFEDDFQKFHNLLTKDANNIHIRKKRDWFIRSIIYEVADQLWKIRSLERGWSDSNNFKALPHYQKIWLDQSYASERLESPEWFSNIKKELSRWFIATYKKLMNDKALALGDEHMSYIKTMIIECEVALL
ncbi:MAG: hypothetical protein PF693_14920 [Spirochaetia bacterium]|jgi:CRISPR-associated protein Csy1|nr:hypothetical protein [Spirochaetia bacterium]